MSCSQDLRRHRMINLPPNASKDHSCARCLLSNHSWCFHFFELFFTSFCHMIHRVSAVGLRLTSRVPVFFSERLVGSFLSARYCLHRSSIIRNSMVDGWPRSAFTRKALVDGRIRSSISGKSLVDGRLPIIDPSKMARSPIIDPTDPHR